jgi:hypothetical protein
VTIARGADLHADDEFAGIAGRRSIDYLFHATQQQLVAYNGQADLKASILITAATLTMSAAVSRHNDRSLRWAIVVLGIGALFAVVFCVIAILPKHRRFRLSEGPRPEQFNLLFFGHFSQLPKDQFLAEMGRTIQQDSDIYRRRAADLWELGNYLEHFKFRFLRYGFIAFLVGVVGASITQFAYSLTQ